MIALILGGGMIFLAVATSFIMFVAYFVHFLRTGQHRDY